jgi:hypothetical protein
MSYEMKTLTLKANINCICIYISRTWKSTFKILLLLHNFFSCLISDFKS